VEKYMTTTTVTSKVDTAAPSQALANTNVQMAAAAILGMVVLMGVGFAPMDVAHNAAHDTRHSFAFPCH
jgi:cobalt transporter subunit CbtB